MQSGRLAEAPAYFHKGHTASSPKLNIGPEERSDIASSERDLTLLAIRIAQGARQQSIDIGRPVLRLELEEAHTEVSSFCGRARFIHNNRRSPFFSCSICGEDCERKRGCWPNSRREADVFTSVTVELTKCVEIARSPALPQSAKSGSIQTFSKVEHRTVFFRSQAPKIQCPSVAFSSNSMLKADKLSRNPLLMNSHAESTTRN